MSAPSFVAIPGSPVGRDSALHGDLGPNSALTLTYPSMPTLNMSSPQNLTQS